MGHGHGQDAAAPSLWRLGSTFHEFQGTAVGCRKVIWSGSAFDPPDLRAGSNASILYIFIIDHTL